jgi:glycosyltransferase involved in cell wall biosynthesis
MKLIIQIPCYNEEKTLPITLKQLPRKVEGFEKVEWLIINDGSKDDTVKIAKENGVDHVINFLKNQGLAIAFMTGLEACVSLGADVIVNTDADNQYNANDIPELVKPILKKKADIVIGTRPIGNIKHFSPIKKLLQKLGSWTVRVASNTKVEDAPSGFRAISREAAMKLNVFNGYTYTLETIIQAGNKNMSITSVPIRVNDFLRPSRLIKSISAYIKRSFLTIFRIFVVYKPFRFFMTLSIIFFILGLIPGIRFLIYFYIEGGKGHIQSLILSAILLIMGAQLGIVALIGDLLAVNRRLLEDVQYRLRKIDSDKNKKK